MADHAMQVVQATQRARVAFGAADRRKIAIAIRAAAAELEAIADKLDPDNADTQPTWIEQERYPDERAQARGHRRD
jgi:hypothetical protein